MIMSGGCQVEDGHYFWAERLHSVHATTCDDQETNALILMEAAIWA